MRACLFTVEGSGTQGRVFAVPMSHVVEFFGASALTPVPTAPPEVAGVAWRRGRVLPVLHLPGHGGRVNPGQSLLALSSGEFHLALAIERVLALAELETDGTAAHPDSPSWIQAVLPAPEVLDSPGPIHLLDIDALIDAWKARLEEAA